MNEDQVKVILGTLRVAYPKFYADMSRQEMLDTIALWTEMFSHENPALVTAAVKNLINTFKWVPTIADIKEEMYRLTETQQETPIEIWNAIKKAMRRASYYAEEEFEALPELAKKFVGSPNQLREWAISNDYNDGVVKGQFLKQYEVLLKRQKDSVMMLPQVKDIVKQLSESTNVNKLLN